MRKKLFLIIEPVDGVNRLSAIYDFIMMSTIIISVIPLAFKETNIIFPWIDYIVNVYSLFVLKIFSQEWISNDDNISRLANKGLLTLLMQLLKEE